MLCILYSGQDEDDDDEDEDDEDDDEEPPKGAKATKKISKAKGGPPAVADGEKPPECKQN